VSLEKKLVFLFTPTAPGRLLFRCDIHPSMKGELLVLTVEKA